MLLMAPRERVACADGDEVSLGVTPRCRVYKQESGHDHKCFQREEFAHSKAIRVNAS